MKLESSFMSQAKEYLILCRFRIALLSAFSAASGVILVSGQFEMTVVGVLGGVFLLACGCSSLNQYQERASDSLMPRTRGRPIPAGRVGRTRGLCFSLALLGLGWSVIVLTAGLVAASLGLLGVMWYNGVYTYLKKKSAFASVPGALTGAMTPAIGWVAGGGSLSDPKVLCLCFFFFLWQVPHFWLLLIRYGIEYEMAGLPSLTRVFRKRQLALITFQWVCAVAVSCSLFALFRVTASAVGNSALLGLSLLLLWNSLPLLREEKDSFRGVFRTVNWYAFLVVLCLVADRVGLLSGFQEAYTKALTAYPYVIDLFLAV
ncbi:MAG: protoheme IX farnesyltransferase [Chloroflexota bacterium]